MLSPAEAVGSFANASFVVAIWHPSRSAGLLDRMAELTRLGARQVSTFIPLLWLYPDELLPNLFWAPQAYFEAHQEEIQAARSLLDTAGQDEFDR